MLPASPAQDPARFCGRPEPVEGGETDRAVWSHLPALPQLQQTMAEVCLLLSHHNMQVGVAKFAC